MTVALPFPPQPPLRTRLLRASACALVTGAFGMVMLSGVVRCPFASLLHQPCPGCGSTRAIRAVLSGDFATAFRFNPMAPIIVACTLVIAVEGLWLVLKHGNAQNLAYRGAGMWAVRLLVVAVALQIPIWGLRFFGLFGGQVPV